MVRTRTEVIANRFIAEGIFRLTLDAPELLARRVMPGQFVHVKTGDNALLLRRPISVYSVERARNRLSLVIQAAGEGTRKLSRLRAGDVVDVVGPLGQGFDVTDTKLVYVTGGGVGVAPLCHTIDEHNADHEIEGFFGYRSAAHAYGYERKDVKIHIATDDGSLGEHGLIIAPLERAMRARRPDLVLVCGPTPMLHAVQKLCADMEVRCQLSLEQRMGCGVGGCLTCNCKIRTAEGWAYRRACMDGPVFDGKDVMLDG